MEEKKSLVTPEQIAAAFKAERNERKSSESAPEPKKSHKQKKSKKLPISIAVLVVGLLALIGGVVWLVLDLTKGPDIEDGEYLLGTWTLDEGTNCVSEVVESETGTTEGIIGAGEEGTTKINGGEANCISTPSVIWQFTEIGKGTLTTNNHTNDYDFIWAIKDDKLLIETDWLYTLENEYTFTLDKSAGELVLTADGKDYRFEKQQ